MGRWHGMPVAAKVLKSNDTALAEDFSRECATLERLRHLHIVQFYANIKGDDGMVRIWQFHRAESFCSTTRLAYTSPVRCALIKTYIPHA